MEKRKDSKECLLYFKYPSFETLRAMTPKDRVTYIQKKFQKDYASIASKLMGHNFELIGTAKKPRGVKLIGNERTLATILKLKFIDKSLSIVPSKKKSKIKVEEPYFCFRVIFQIQIEG